MIINNNSNYKKSEKQIPRFIQQAIESAVSQRDVAHIAIPTDLLTLKIEKIPSPIQTFIQKNCMILPDDEALHQD